MRFSRQLHALEYEVVQSDTIRNSTTVNVEGILEAREPFKFVADCTVEDGLALLDALWRTQPIEVTIATRDTSEIQRARIFANYWHMDQKYGEHPYIKHLDDVAALVPDALKPLAYLHDVLEDTEATFNLVCKTFGEELGLKVMRITDPPGHETRGAKKRFQNNVFASLTENDFDVLHVKTADRLANVRACMDTQRPVIFARYAIEHEEFRKAVYRPGLCDHLWAELNAYIVGVTA